MNRRSARLLLVGIAALAFALDQATKAIAVTALEGQPRIAVLGNFAGFVFLRNPGAAFGLGASSTWIFAAIAVIVFFAIVIAARRLSSPLWAVGLGLLQGGLLGNLFDRLFRPPGFFHGAVVDFIDLHFFVCNVADIAITGAAAILMLAALKGTPLDEAQAQSEENHD